jgi:hypothetical protein
MNDVEFGIHVHAKDNQIPETTQLIMVSIKVTDALIIRISESTRCACGNSPKIFIFIFKFNRQFFNRIISNEYWGICRCHYENEDCHKSKIYMNPVGFSGDCLASWNAKY